MIHLRVVSLSLKTLDRDGNGIICPSCGIYSYSAGACKGTLIVCPHCHTSICGKCKMQWHGQRPCTSHVKDFDGLTTVEDDKMVAATSKKCPKCAAAVSDVVHDFICSLPIIAVMDVIISKDVLRAALIGVTVVDP